MTTNHKTWTRLYGKTRAASDRALLKELEQQIEREETNDCEMRETIARAFGRPVQNPPEPSS